MRREKKENILIYTRYRSLIEIKNLFPFNPSQCNVWESPSSVCVYLSWLWSQIQPKNHVPLKGGINFNSFDPFLEYFSTILQKISENWKFTEKLLKMSEIFKICNYWAISTSNTSKESIFHIEFNFKQKKYNFLLKKKCEKINFSHYFFQNWYWPVIFDYNCFKFLAKNLKTEWLYALERFWK